MTKDYRLKTNYMILPKVYQVKIIENTKLSSKVHKIVLELVDPKNLIFMAGQFLMYNVSDGVKRAYSIASLPVEEGRIELLIDISPNGPASKYFASVPVGTENVITAPYGLFILRDSPRDKIFITASTGIAPARSMIRDYLTRQNMKNNNQSPKLTLYFGVNCVEELFLLEEFRKLEETYSNFKYVPVVSEPESEWQGEKGLVDVPLLRDEKILSDKDIYVCGSPKMVPAVKQKLLDNGAVLEQIYNEKY